MALDCDAPVTPVFPNMKRVECDISEDDDGEMREWSTFECNRGYEFKFKSNKTTIWTNNGVIEEFLMCSRKTFFGLYSIVLMNY